MTASDSNSITVNKHALGIIENFAPDAAAYMLQYSLSGLLFGVLTLLTLSSIFLLLRRGSLFSAPNRIPLLSTVILYASTSLYMAALVWNWTSVAHIISAANAGMLSDAYDGRADLHVLEMAALKQTQMVAVALGINVILGDAVVWWRACVIWQYRAVYCAGPALLLLTLVCGIIGALRSVSRGPITAIYIMCGGNGFADVAAALSLVTNIAATSLIAIKAFLHQRRLKKYLGAFGTKSQVLKVLALLIESGSVYSIILLVVLVFQFNAEATSRRFNAEYYFVYGCLVPIVAIYPTGIIVLTAVNCSPLDLGISISPPGDFDEASSRDGIEWWKNAENGIA